MSICRPGQNMNSVSAQNETGRHFVLSPEGKKRAKMKRGTETAWKTPKTDKRKSQVLGDRRRWVVDWNFEFFKLWRGDSCFAITHRKFIMGGWNASIVDMSRGICAKESRCWNGCDPMRYMNREERDEDPFCPPGKRKRKNSIFENEESFCWNYYNP